MKKAIIFDCDGVLVNSLPAHLDACKYYANLHNIRSASLTPSDMKNTVRAGHKISPMSEFFRAVGFPKFNIEEAVRWYENSFTNLFKVPMFPGADQLLHHIKVPKDVYLALVTSNTMRNVSDALGENILLFDALVTKDKMLVRGNLTDITVPANKALALLAVTAYLEVDPDNSLYVGDMQSDLDASKKAGVPFLGVGWGWGFSDKDDDPPRLLVAHDMEHAAHIIMRFMRPEKPPSLLVKNSFQDLTPSFNFAKKEMLSYKYAVEMMQQKVISSLRIPAHMLRVKSEPPTS